MNASEMKQLKKMRNEWEKMIKGGSGEGVGEGRRYWEWGLWEGWWWGGNHGT